MIPVCTGLYGIANTIQAPILTAFLFRVLYKSAVFFSLPQGVVEKMPAEIHKQILDYQGGDANAALELVEKFKPLIKRYAFFLHREDSFEDLQRFLLSMLKTWDTSRLSSTDDATVTRYIANSVKNEYI